MLMLILILALVLVVVFVLDLFLVLALALAQTTHRIVSIAHWSLLTLYLQVRSRSKWPRPARSTDVAARVGAVRIVTMHMSVKIQGACGVEWRAVISTSRR